MMSSSSWLHSRIQGLRFRERVALLPQLAATALGVIVVVTLLASVVVDVTLARIERERYPRVQARWTLQVTLGQMQRELQDAVGASDASLLQRADSLRDEFRRTLTVAGLGGAQDEGARTMTAQFDAYYRVARSASQRLIGGAPLDSVDLPAMTARFNALRIALDAARRSDEAAVEQAFRSARRMERGAWLVTFLAALGCVLLLRRVSRVGIASVTEPLADVARAAERLAQGDVGAAAREEQAVMAASAAAAHDDEIGRLVRAMRDALGYMGGMASAADAIAAGRLGERLDARSEADAFGNAFANMGDYLATMADVADRIASGDLTATITPRSRDDRFGQAFVAMRGRLASTLGELRAGADAVQSAAAELTSSAQQLNEGAREEAESVERTTASLAAVSGAIARTAEQSRRTEDLATRGVDSAETGGRAAEQTTAAMDAIAGSVSIINRIAEQTNLLALNAAIEAARAGTHGKGFAVLAAEIRKLSDDSRRAADAINATATESKAIAEQSRDRLGELVPAIREAAHAVQVVAASSAEQVQSLTGVAASMGQLDGMARRNATSAEHLAAMAEELAAQATALHEAAGVFRTDAAVQAPADAYPVRPHAPRRATGGAVRSALLLAALVMPATRARAQTGYYDIDGGRPVRIEAAHPEARHAFQLQLAPLRVEKADRGPSRARLEPKLAYGILPRTEVEVRAPLTYRRDRGRTTGGLAGIGLGALLAFNAESEHLPATALAADVLLPTGRASSGGASITVKALLTRTFATGRLHVNAAIGTFGNAAGSLPSCSGSSADSVGVNCSLGPPPGTDGLCSDLLATLRPSASMLRGARPVAQVATDGASPAAVPATGHRWVAGLAWDRALPLSSTLLVADLFAEGYSGVGAAADVTAEVGVRHQVGPHVVMDVGAGRRFAGASRAWIVTFGSAYAFSVSSLMRGSTR